MTMEAVGPSYMTYDGENRMTGYSGGSVANYGYDGNGLRIAKSVQGGTTTVSIFSGSSVIAEYDNGAAPNAPSREYVDGPNGLLAMFSGGATTYYHQDDKSVRLTTDASGNIATQQGTLPFGESWYQSGAANNFTFTSYDRDSESGLDYALARYYDSRTGTFCSADPLAGSAGDPQSWNRYPYGRTDPINVTDPSGQSWWMPLLQLGIAIAGDVLPGLAPAVFAWLGPGTAGEVTSTVFYNGQVIGRSAEAYAWGAGGAILGGTAAATLSAKPPIQTPQTPPMPTKSPCTISAKSLDDYLTRKHSPLVGQGANLMAAGEKFNVDPRFIVSLSGAETTFGTAITKGANNAWNWFYNGPGKQAPFDSFQSGITSVSRGIGAGRNYLNGNPPLTNVNTIYAKYCSGKDCPNGLANIKKFMNEQDANSNSLRYPCKHE